MKTFFIFILFMNLMATIALVRLYIIWYRANKNK